MRHEPNIVEVYVWPDAHWYCKDLSDYPDVDAYRSALRKSDDYQVIYVELGDECADTDIDAAVQVALAYK